MGLPLIAIQSVLPVLLIAWLAFSPAGSRAGFVVQAAGTGLALLALALVGMWVLPPWWTPYVHGLLWLLAVTARCWRFGLTFARPFPAKRIGWAGLAIVATLGAAGGYLSFEALLGRRLPEAAVADIPLPLRGTGTYLVAHGGSRQLINGHMMTLDPAVERFSAYRGQSYAIDLLKVDRLGLRAPGLRPEDPSAYAIFGEPVFAPCDGTVIAARNDLPDMPVPVLDRENLAGNHVMLQCGDVALLFAHFRQASVRFEAGDRAKAGEQLGEVGNSGKSSEPHLHLHAQRPGQRHEPLAGEPMALTIEGRFLVRNDRILADGD